MPTVAGYELLEHTADLGLRAWAPTAPEALEHAARALAEIMGVAVQGRGRAERCRCRPPTSRACSSRS
jgi:SHS2 domain-containing protein